MCSGPMFQYQICNSEVCPGPYEVDIRYLFFSF